MFLYDYLLCYSIAYCIDAHLLLCIACVTVLCFFFQAEDGIRDLVRSRGLGDVYKRQLLPREWPGNGGQMLSLQSFGFDHMPGHRTPLQRLSLIHI